MRITSNYEDLPELPGGYITVSKAAADLEMSRQGIHRMVNKRQLRAWRVPSANPDQDPVLVLAKDVEDLAEERKGAEIVEVVG